MPGDASRARAWKDDLVAGVSVALLLVPQALAYAQLAGVPPYLGLYAALLPPVVGALFGSCVQLSTGPVALTSLLTAASVVALAPRGSEAFVAGVVLLALMSGILQLAFGLLRLGAVLDFLSHPVLMGFLNGAAVIIIVSQLPTLLGIGVPQTDRFLGDAWELITRLGAIHLPSLAIGACAIGSMLAFGRWLPRAPGVLVTVCAALLASRAIDFAGLGGAIVGAIPTGLPKFGVPQADWATIVRLLPASAFVAVVSFMEVASSAKIISIRTRTPWDENRELIGQGLAKIAAALTLTMPVSASFSRSALNLSCRAHSALASVVAAGAVLLTLLFLTPLLGYLPKPVLAAVIIVAVAQLTDLRTLWRAWRADRDDGLAAALTLVATIAFAPSIQWGIVLGVLLSVGLVLYRLMRPRVAVLGLHADGTLRDARVHQLPLLHARLRALRFDGDLRFMNTSYFHDAVIALARESPGATHILLTFGGVNQIDASGIEELYALVTLFRDQGVTLTFSGIKKQVQEAMVRTGLTSHIGTWNIFATDRMAVDELRARLDKPTSLAPSA
jgi:sulfate permease, SulP family